ncbi:MAG TPA: trehalose-6-phosphate synthase [Thermoleophilia bacterium]|nr:trehalose-6-phosphate synthase [Thermoleophilia bacterium]HQG54150.1 trehalose-6-phosphate synthase [Thermoleophilia bacterium]
MTDTSPDDRYHLVVAANRGPVSFHDDPYGEPVVTRGPGGLVTVLTEVLRRYPGTWVAAAVGGEELRLAAGESAAEVELDGDVYRLRYVAIDPDVYHKYYSVVANPMLWFIQHYLWDLGRHPDVSAAELDAWQHGYLPVNRLFADTILKELAAGTGDADGRPPVVMLHDYHLYCVAPSVRQHAGDVFLHQFVHIPWSQSDYWRVLPDHIRGAIYEGLLANDIIAFHTEHYVQNFLRCCSDLLDLPVDYRARTVAVQDREVWVRAYPVSIDPSGLRSAARARRALAAEREILRKRREHLILRVDRLDPSKNVIRGFVAFGRFLELHPEFRERVTFLALLQPSRTDVEEYVTYREHVERVAADINAQHGATDWMPIDLRIQDDFPVTVAAYKHYDVLLVNAISDGMNLVAKEGPVLNRRDGVLVLSEHAGAYEELGAFALGVNPFNIEQQAEAIYKALTMDADERAARSEQLRRVVEGNSIEKWIAAQVADIRRKLAGEV